MEELKQKLEQTLNRLYRENKISIDTYVELMEFADPNFESNNKTLLMKIEKECFNYGLNMNLYILKTFDLKDGFGSVSWVNKNNNKEIPYEEITLQCDGFFYDNDELIQMNIPKFT